MHTAVVRPAQLSKLQQCSLAYGSIESNQWKTQTDYCCVFFAPPCPWSSTQFTQLPPHTYLGCNQTLMPPVIRGNSHPSHFCLTDFCHERCASFSDLNVDVGGGGFPGDQVKVVRRNLKTVSTGEAPADTPACSQPAKILDACTLRRSKPCC